MIGFFLTWSFEKCNTHEGLFIYLFYFYFYKPIALSKIINMYSEHFAAYNQIDCLQMCVFISEEYQLRGILIVFFKNLNEIQIDDYEFNEVFPPSIL